MSEHICGIQMSVICVDGSKHDGVTLKIAEDVVIYETLEGTKLTGSQKVVSTESALFSCTLEQLTAAILKYREQEQ